MSEDARLILERILEGKRFVFLGEPDHFFIEKYSFRLTFIQYLFANGWQHLAMENGRSVGWRIDQYLKTGDASYWHFDLPRNPHNPLDAATLGRMSEFIGRYEYSSFPEQLRQISESCEDVTSRLHYMGFDLDLGVPLGSAKPIRLLLEKYTQDKQIKGILRSLNELTELSTDQQLAQVEAIQGDVTAQTDTLTKALGQETFEELQSWMCFLHDSITAEKRPRMKQDPRGHRLWRAERERLMMRYLDKIVDGLDGDEKIILMGHNGHLSKDAANLYNHPQQNLFWGVRSWFRALGYGMWAKIHRCPLDLPGGSVGTHLHQRFPDKVLAIWTFYGQGQLMGPNGPINICLHNDTIESLLAQVGDRFLLPLDNVDPRAQAVLTNANFRWASGRYASANLTAQTDAIYFIKHVTAE
jgi:erythromycin esterase-like protein